MPSTDDKDFARFQSRMTAALALATDARRTLKGAPGPDRPSLAPYLDNCARELERAASALRAAAEDAAHRPIGQI